MLINSIINKIGNSVKHLLQRDIHENKILTGTLLAKLNETKSIRKLSEVEFKVFSQWGDDGIIQYLVSKISIPDHQRIFVEFGVENYTESNTRFLLLKDNWKGQVIDGSQAHINYIKGEALYWRHTLTATCAFITKDNINSLIKQAGIEGEIGILSVDIDGNDYWVWKEINVINPIIVIVEYNSIWGYKNPYTIIYKGDFVRGNAHYSNLFYGTSLLSACDLAEEKGYDFIGCNSAGNNAYFIRKDKNVGFKKLTAEEGFVDAKFRESRSADGKLTLLTGEAKRNEIKGLEVYNTRTNKIEVL